MEMENLERYGEVKTSKKARDYTGFTKTGVYTRLLPVVKDLFIRFLRNTKNKIRRYHLNEISFDKLLESFNSWFAYLGHANNFGLRK